MIANAEADRRDLAEFFKPTAQRGALGFATDCIEIIYEIARDCDEIWRLLFSEHKGAMHVCCNAAREMDVAQRNNSAGLLLWLEKAVRAVVESIHIT